jgi:hypothetical protein
MSSRGLKPPRKSVSASEIAVIVYVSVNEARAMRSHVEMARHRDVDLSFTQFDVPLSGPFDWLVDTCYHLITVTLKNGHTRMSETLDCN